MNNEDDNIQRMLDNLSKKEIESFPADNDDVHAYKMLFIGLSEPPSVNGDIDLRESVMNVLRKRKDQKEFIRYTILISMIFLSGIAGIIFSLQFMQPEILDQLTNLLKPLAMPVIFSCCCITIIHFLDANLLNKRHLT